MYEFLQAVQIFAGEYVVHPPMDVDVPRAAAGFYHGLDGFVAHGIGEGADDPVYRVDQLVLTQGGHRLVKGVVCAEAGFDYVLAGRAGGGGLEVLQLAPDVGQLLRVLLLDSEAHDADLYQLAQLHKAVKIPGAVEYDAVDHRVDHALLESVGNECALRPAAFQDAQIGEYLRGLTHAGARNAKLGGKFRLARQAVAGLELAGDHAVSQAVYNC